MDKSFIIAQFFLRIMHISVVYILVFLISYVVGSIPFSWIITKLVTGKNLREVGSGNVGGRNVYRATGSAKWAWTAGLLDVLRTIVATVSPYFLAYDLYFSKITLTTVAGPFFLDTQWSFCLAIAGFGAILGHNWPLYLLSHGGRGITVVIGTMVFANPILLGFWILLWPIVITIVGYSSITYVVVTALVGVIGFFLQPPLLMPWALSNLSIGLLLIGIALIMLSRQGDNIRKIRAGEAKKMKIWKALGGKKKLSEEILK